MKCKVSSSWIVTQRTSSDKNLDVFSFLAINSYYASGLVAKTFFYRSLFGCSPVLQGLVLSLHRSGHSYIRMNCVQLLYDHIFLRELLMCGGVRIKIHLGVVNLLDLVFVKYR